jgi:glycosyltransferase involved in cell wall biosynthesis
MEPTKYLLLLTDFYPYRRHESFIKNEMEYLPDHFKGIFVFHQYESNDPLESIYELPKNVKALPLHARITLRDRFMSMRFLFNKIFWDEIKLLPVYGLKFSPAIARILLIEFQRSRNCKKQLENFLRKNNLEHEDLIVYAYWTDYRAIAAAQMTSRKNIVAISRAHNSDVYFERQRPPFLPFRKYLHDHLNAQFFVSESGCRYSLAKIPNVDKTKYRVSKLGTKFFSRNPDAKGEEFIIVSCSRLSVLKRVDLIAEIVHNLDFPVRWIHYGDGPLRNEFLKKTDQLFSGLKNVRFEFKGMVDNDVIYQFYSEQHVDLFLLTSEYEGMPVSIMEALSFGIPVMGTMVGGMDEMVGQNNGFPLPKNVVVADAAAIIRNYFLSNEETKKSYRENAFRTWQEKFNADVNYPKFIEEILSL